MVAPNPLELLLSPSFLSTLVSKALAEEVVLALHLAHSSDTKAVVTTNLAGLTKGEEKEIGVYTLALGDGVCVVYVTKRPIGHPLTAREVKRKIDCHPHLRSLLIGVRGLLVSQPGAWSQVV